MFSDLLIRYAQDIVDATQSIAGHPVSITNDKAIILAAWDKKRIGTLHASSFSVIENGRAEGLYEEEAKKLGVYAGICLPLRIEDKIVGTISVAGVPDHVSKYAHLVQKEAELFLREISLKESALLRDSALNNLVNMVISQAGGAEEISFLVSHAASLGYDITTPKIVLIVDLINFKMLVKQIQQEEAFSHEAELRIQAVKLTILTQLRNLLNSNLNIITNISSDKYIVILDISNMPSNDIAKNINQKANAIIDHLKSNGYTATVSIGSIANSPNKIRQSYSDAISALRIGTNIYHTQNIYDIHTLSLEKLLLSLNPASVKSYLEKTLGQYEQSEFWNDEIEATIQEYIKNPFRISEVSANLKIHRNTLYHRLDKIQENLGIDLKNPDDVVRLRICCLLHMLFKG